MTTYAGIVGGIVTRVLTPPIAIAYFSGPGITWVDVTATVPQPISGAVAVQATAGGAWTFTNPALSLPQQAAALLAGGLAVTSTATAALNGTYGASSSAQRNIVSEMLSILANGTFADGTTTAAWFDVSGAAHSFSAAQFKTLATAVGAFVSACQKVINGLPGATLPVATATIA